MTKRLTLMLAIAIVLLVNSLAGEGGALDQLGHGTGATQASAETTPHAAVENGSAPAPASRLAPARIPAPAPLIEDYAGPEFFDEPTSPMPAGRTNGTAQRSARQRTAQPDGSLSPAQLGVEV